jgi:hypothetical protein
MTSPTPPPAALDLDEVRQFASPGKLAVIPATPIPSSNAGHLVLLDSTDVSAAEFCELATRAGARLLYVQAAGFDAGTDLYLEPGPGTGAQLAELRREAERHNGRIRQLELGFSVGGILHSWAAVADWYDRLIGRAAALRPAADPGPKAAPAPGGPEPAVAGRSTAYRRGWTTVPTARFLLAAAESHIIAELQLARRTRERAHVHHGGALARPTCSLRRYGRRPIMTGRSSRRSGQRSRSRAGWKALRQ